MSKAYEEGQVWFREGTYRRIEHINHLGAVTCAQFGTQHREFVSKEAFERWLEGAILSLPFKSRSSFQQPSNITIQIPMSCTADHFPG